MEPANNAEWREHESLDHEDTSVIPQGVVYFTTRCGEVIEKEPFDEEKVDENKETA